MKKIFTKTIVLLFLLSGTSLMAQEVAQEAKTTSSAPSNSNWEKYMAVGEMHKMLASSDGDWKAQMSFWSAPGAEPQKSSASCKYEMILGGRFQEARVEGTVMGMPFEGRGMVGYDNLKKVFMNTWIDNTGTGIMYSEGPFDSKTKSINMKGSSMDPMTGKEMKFREVFTFVSDNNQKLELFMMRDGKEFKSMEIDYVR